MKVVNFPKGMELGSLAIMLYNYKNKFLLRFGAIICLLIALRKVILSFLGKILWIKITINY
jgi:hypothetical protein